MAVAFMENSAKRGSRSSISSSMSR